MPARHELTRDRDWTTALTVLRLSARLVDGIQDGVLAAGFTDVTPLHGFAFGRLATGDATTADLAAHLGVTKQAAAQLVERLVRAGYVSRHPHPDDHRARLLRLTERGHACTMAARRAAEDAVAAWRDELPAGQAGRFAESLAILTRSSAPLRPAL
jgi:DNA-binding MarR family transcriptional regulator